MHGLGGVVAGRRSLLAVGLCLAAALCAPSAASAAPRCQDVRVPTSVAPLVQWTVAASLCWEGTTPPDTVQVLLPGGTYNRLYWNFPYEPETYSYVWSATAAGYATLAVDRPGTGQSTHPLTAELLTPDLEAAAIHQVISALRRGDVGGHAFKRVVLVGHSVGSVVAWPEAATYHDVDAVVITGLLHGFATAGVAMIATDLYPAMLDPKFAGQIVDPSYITTRPGMRGAMFYAPDADPRVIAIDEATKDLASVNEVALGTVSMAGVSSQITAPVLLAVGSKDVIFCGIGGTDCSSAATVLAHERGLYSSAPCLDATVLQGSGHDINLDPNAPTWFASARTWLDHVVGPNGGPVHC